MSIFDDLTKISFIANMINIKIKGDIVTNNIICCVLNNADMLYLCCGKEKLCWPTAS